MRQHKLLEKTNKAGDKVYAIQFTDAPYEGIIFSYGAVKLEEDDVYNELHVKFEYEIHQEPAEPYIKEELETELGDFLVQKIAQQLEEGQLVYRGGTD